MCLPHRSHRVGNAAASATLAGPLPPLTLEKDVPAQQGATARDPARQGKARSSLHRRAPGAVT